MKKRITKLFLALFALVMSVNLAMAQCPPITNLRATVNSDYSVTLNWTNPPPSSWEDATTHLEYIFYVGTTNVGSLDLTNGTITTYTISNTHFTLGNIYRLGVRLFQWSETSYYYPCIADTIFTYVIITNPVNMDRYIELTVQQGAEIWLGFMVDAPYTEVRVVCGTYDTTFVADARWTTFVDESTQATTIKFYGNVSGFQCIDHGEKVTGLDASNNTGLVVLDCWNNNLSSLDVSGLSVLEHFNCRENNLSSLDVSGLTALKSLYCYSNNLSFIDASGLTALEALACYDNNISAIKINGCENLQRIYCDRNNLSACGLDSLFHQLPRRQESNKGEIYIKAGVFTNPGTLTCRDTIATNRNWKVLDYNDENEEIPIVNENYECPYFTLGIEELIVNNINARVYPNPVSNYLNIECEESINKLELYDAFGRIVISQESVQNNSSIDVSSLANGIYILKLRTAEGVGEYKVVKD